MAQQLTISIEDAGIMSSLRRFLSSIKGVTVEQWPQTWEAQAASKTRAATQALDFPRIPKGRSLSPTVMEMVVGQLPDDFDLEKASDEMWEERAQ